MAKPRRTPRLAGDGIHAHWVGRQGASETDFDQRDLSPVLQGDAGPAAKRSGESLAGARSAFAPIGGDDSRSSAGSERLARRENRRTIRKALSAEGAVEGAGRRGLHTRSRTRSVSAQSLYILEAHGGAAIDDDVRRGGPRDLRRARDANQYALAGPEPDERGDVCRSGSRPGPAHPDRRRANARGTPQSGLPPGNGPAAAPPGAADLAAWLL